jgi:NTE family protein
VARKGGGAAAPKRVNLALQGGGAHGAFTWGVLDRLLDDERLAVEAISATSAGAMNAAVFAQGMMDGGRQGAKDALRRFWKSVSDKATPMSRMYEMGRSFVGDRRRLDNSPAFVALDFTMRVLSPYQFNPFNYNPLREVLEDMLDVERLRGCQDVKLFISATNVKTCRVKVFETPDVNVDVLMAAACLPFLFQAVEIDGEHYWDGGYMGNPAIYPLIYRSQSADVVVVHINPIRRDAVPTSARDILDRINEISFNSSLMREMRVIEFVSRMIDDGTIAKGRMKRMLVHAVEAEDAFGELGVSSKLNPDWNFLTHLFEIGRERCDQWLAENFDRIGRESSVDLRERFL